MFFSCRSGSNNTTPRPNYTEYVNIEHEQGSTESGNNSPQNYHVTSDAQAYYPNTSMSYGETSDDWGSTTISDSEGTSDTETGNVETPVHIEIHTESSDTENSSHLSSSYYSSTTTKGKGKLEATSESSNQIEKIIWENSKLNEIVEYININITDINKPNELIQSIGRMRPVMLKNEYYSKDKIRILNGFMSENATMLNFHQNEAIILNLHPSDYHIRQQLQEIVGNVKFQIFCGGNADKFEQLSPAFEGVRNGYKTMINSIKETVIESNNLSNLAYKHYNNFRKYIQIALNAEQATLTLKDLILTKYSKAKELQRDVLIYMNPNDSRIIEYDQLEPYFKLYCFVKFIKNVGEEFFKNATMETIYEKPKKPVKSTNQHQVIQNQWDYLKSALNSFILTYSRFNNFYKLEDNMRILENYNGQNCGDYIISSDLPENLEQFVRN
uniref:Uncharacterized protein n=1 Tax=Meloidogyne floridensis TaxID=298350 RepID=A0A915PC59_9BILA